MSHVYYLQLSKRGMARETTMVQIFFSMPARYKGLVKPASTDVSQLLKAWSAGDQTALNELTPKVYQELRQMAGRYMRRQQTGNTLQATALVHEVFLKLVDADGVTWQDRAHFFAVAATIMRRILVDRARAKGSAKRGGEALQVSLDEAPQVAGGSKDREMVAIDEALDALAQVDPRKARVVELRFFGGLSVEESAEVLKISPQTVMRDWKTARAWLMAEITG
jgi:RNA polymerase sigma factor (TIGR02999 family)